MPKLKWNIMGAIRKRRRAEYEGGGIVETKNEIMSEGGKAYMAIWAIRKQSCTPVRSIEKKSKKKPLSWQIRRKSSERKKNRDGSISEKPLISAKTGGERRHSVKMNENQKVTAAISQKADDIEASEIHVIFYIAQKRKLEVMKREWNINKKTSESNHITHNRSNGWNSILEYIYEK